MTKLFLAFAMCMIFTSAALAETCQEKVKSIQTEIDHAKKHNNTKRLDGLETALKKTQSNCTDQKLADHKKNKIRDRQADVDKAQQKLDAAIAEKRSPKKIEKMQRKLEEQKQELLKEMKD